MPLIQYLRERLVPLGTISKEDVDLLFVTDSPVEAVAHLRRGASEYPELRFRPRTVLGERG
jgi:predicted Rossmann-fold nucleotide-binding protein